MRASKHVVRSLLATGLTAAMAMMVVGCDDDDDETPDSGVHPDATSNVHPDAAAADASNPADAGTEDATTHPDAEVTDTGGGGFTPPADHVALSFEIDDSANQTYTQGELRWKGSWQYNSDTRILTRDPSWTGPYPTLWDDGPWNAGGHEMAGAVAGDHKWSITVWYPVPQADTSFEYGAENNSGWIWVGPNGTFTVSAGQTTPITATGLTIAPFGTTDMRLTIDMDELDAQFSEAETSTIVQVKSGRWGWSLKDLKDDGTNGDQTANDRVYTFELSKNLGAHEGLLNPGDQPRFVFVLNGVEYKGTFAPFSSSVPLVAGVAAEIKPANGAYTAVTIGHDDTNDHNTYITVPFVPPADHVALSFEIDDSANQTYTQGELRWKGSWQYNAESRVLTRDPSWSGPYPTLWDDGPWNMGGHEKAGAVAGDHKWSITVWYPVPQADTSFEYGAENNSGWIWVGPNGTFTITAGQTTPVNAQGLVIAPFGTTDLRLKLDMNGLDAQFEGAETSSVVQVKSGRWGWSLKDLKDDATMGDQTANDRVYTFVLSENLGAHEGLLNSGDEPRFVFVINGVEYKGTLAPFSSSVPLVAGVTAELKPANGAFTAATIAHDDTNDHNTYVTVP